MNLQQQLNLRVARTAFLVSLIMALAMAGLSIWLLVTNSTTTTIDRYCDSGPQLASFYKCGVDTLTHTQPELYWILILPIAATALTVYFAIAWDKHRK